MEAKTNDAVNAFEQADREHQAHLARLDAIRERIDPDRAGSTRGYSFRNAEYAEHNTWLAADYRRMARENREWANESERGAA